MKHASTLLALAGLAVVAYAFYKRSAPNEETLGLQTSGKAAPVRLDSPAAKPEASRIAGPAQTLPDGLMGHHMVRAPTERRTTIHPLDFYA